MAWKSCVLKTCLALAAGSAMTLQGPSRVCAQYSLTETPKTQAAAEPEGKSLGESATTIIPSLRLGERYDSNVFFTRGAKLEDYVTTVSPQLKAIHKNQWVEAAVGGGATGEVYVKNPGLNYVGANGSLTLNLDGAVNALVRGMGLRVSDSINYTPQPSAFGISTGGSQISEAFVQGLQARRANSLANIANVEATYFLSPYLGISTTYVDRRIRFGRGIATPDGIVPSGEFINTNFQTLNSGLVMRPSPVDTISLSHQYRKSTFSVPDREDRGFSTHGAIGSWTRSITPELKVTGQGGFSVLTRGGSSVYPVGGASFEWEGQYTTVSVSYERAIAPSFLFVSTAMLSQSLTGMVARQVAEPFSLSLSASYAVNNSVPDGSRLRFESYSVTPSLRYKIGQNLTATLSYTRADFQRVVSGQSVDFDRNMVRFQLLAEWR